MDGWMDACVDVWMDGCDYCPLRRREVAERVPQRLGPGPLRARRTPRDVAPPPGRAFYYIYIYIYIYNDIHTYITLHYITLRYVTLHYVTLRYVTLRYVTLHYITLHTYVRTYVHTYIHTYTHTYIHFCLLTPRVFH